MDEKRMKAAEARKKYDAENMAILATKMKRDEAQAFKDLAAKEGTTVGKKLSPVSSGRSWLRTERRRPMFPLS